MPNKKLPLVSIITPSYNQGQYIEETIKSVLSQNYPYIEYIIVDGGSTDDTLNILKRYSSGIKLVSEPDNGQADAINKGLKMAGGEIVAWLNSDDTYNPGAIKGAVEFLIKNANVAMIYSNGYEIDGNGNIVREFPASQRFDLWKIIYVWDYILQPTVFMRRDALFEVGLLDTSLEWCMDWDLWIKFGKIYKVLYVSMFFANSRIHDATKTSTGGFRRFREIVRILRKYGNKKYPPGFFIYGEDTLGHILRERFPALYRLLPRHPLNPLLRLRFLFDKMIHGKKGIFQDNWAARRAFFTIPVPGRNFLILLPKNSLLRLRFLFYKMIHGKKRIFQDNWVTKRAYFTIPVQGGDILIIEGIIPSLDEILPLKIEIEINKKEKSIMNIGKTGPFCIKYNLKHNKNDLIDITVNSNKAFMLSNADINNGKRKLSFFLKDIYITSNL